MSGPAQITSFDRVFPPALSAWARLWRTPSLPTRAKIIFSSRLRISLGRTRPQSGRITLNARLASVPRAVVLEILCHEAAHVAVHLRYGPRARPHGPEWRSLVQAAGYQPTTALKCSPLPVPPSQPHAPARRYQYRCPVCHTSYWRRQRSARLVCSNCDRSGLTVPLRLCLPSHPQP